MTNHAHLLATPSIPDGVSRLMQDIGREYVRYVNKTYRRSGTLWEGRFKSSLVDSEAYCLVCHRYIELNPVRAGMVDDLADYRWSSYATNALGKESSLHTPHALWLSLGSDTDSRCRAYRALFSESLPESVLEEIRYDNRKGLPLGRPIFKCLVESQLQIKLGTGKVGRPSKTAQIGSDPFR
jgi:putative transposase